MDEQMNIATIVTSTDLDVFIYGWLDAKQKKSGSEKTKQAYMQTLFSFRHELQQHGLDLDTKDNESLIKIALLAQAFSGYSSRPNKQVKPATINQRLACISSFYAYAIKKGYLQVNPIGRVDRSKVQSYASAAALKAEQITDALARIDRASERGKRDYALLAVLLSTGRRLSEVADLTLAHIQWSAGIATLTFDHCKGGKTLRDTLSAASSKALAEWLTAFYGDGATKLVNDPRPVWTVLKTAGIKKQGSVQIIQRGEKLGDQSFADITKKYLGTSKVHTTRHTWAHTMEKAGAKVSTIQSRLGHESLATTGRYLAALSSAENEYADTVSANMGIL